MIGKKLSHFQIEAKLGEGGMGQVYEARDVELDRIVALKFLPDDMAGEPRRLERFRREAKALASLDHPNIVTVHGIDEAEGRRFLVMERVEGESLDRILPAGGLPLAEVLNIAVPIADALAAAHGKGIVHRDLKPANVMVTRSGRVKLLDFGLARWTEQTPEPEGSGVATSTTALTGKGAVMGTIPYMSPEQLRGRPADSRTDVFSLGILLYEIASGRSPFPGETSFAIASSILNDTPPLLTEVRPGLPRELERIVHSCLEKNPDERTQTAGEVHRQLEALKRSLAGEVPAPATTRRKWVAAVAAVGLLLTLAGYFALRTPRGSDSDTAASQGVSSRAPMIVVLPFENLGEAGDEYFADGMTEEITSRLAGLNGLGVISRTSAMQYKDSRPSVRRLGEELGVDYLLEGTVRWQRAASGPSRVRVTLQLIRVSEDTHLWAERYDAVLADIFEVQSDIAREVIERLDVALLESQRPLLEARPTENLEAYDFFLRGNDYLHRGQELFRPDELLIAVEMYHRALELDEAFALAYARESVAHSLLYDQMQDRTEARLASAQVAADRALELDPELPAAHFALGAIYRARQQGSRALDEYRIVLESQPSNAELYEAISEVQTDLGQWEDSLVTMRKAMELNPRLGRLACWVGGRCFGLRDFRQAVAHHDRAIQLTPDRACPYWCKTLIYLNWDASTTRARAFLEGLPGTIDLEDSPPVNYPWVQVDLIDGRYDEALERLSSGAAPVYGFINFFIPKDLLKAQVYGLTNRPELERAHYEAARDILEARILEAPQDPRMRSSLGIAYAGLGRREDAIREGKLGVELLGGARDFPFGWRIKDLAQIYLMVGDVEDAIDQLEQLFSVPGMVSAGYVKIDPTFEPLREHPRFLALLEKY